VAHPSATHSWATAVKVSGAGTPADPFRPEVHTISWMPATLVIRPLHLRPEAGVNLDLATTLRVAAGRGWRVTAWGPFAVDGDYYQKFVAQQALLDAGGRTYQAIDPPCRSGVSNCFHAVAEVEPDADRLFGHPIFLYGNAASRRIVRALERRGRLHGPGPEWLAGWLGLNQPLPAAGDDDGR
jgi:hypothetical protein